MSRASSVIPFSDATALSAVARDTPAALSAPPSAPPSRHPRPASSPRATFVNWGRSFTCTPLALFEPASEDHCALVLELAKRDGKTLRAVGVGHSPSDLACTTEYMMRMTKLDAVLEVNAEKRYVVAQGGITLHKLHQDLAAHGLGMTTVGAISDPTLAGCISTATHGSGINYPAISSYVLGLLVLTADGAREQCSLVENSDLFNATLCGLGSTGIILQVKLQVEDRFCLKEVQEMIPFEESMQRMNAWVESEEYARMWYFPHTDSMLMSSYNRTTEPKNPDDSFFWGTIMGHYVVELLLLLSSFPMLSFLMALTGRFAAWLISARTVGIDDSWKIFNTDCRYPQHITEWAVPYESAESCMRDVRAWLLRELENPRSGLRAHIQFPVEIRFSAADDVWLSPANGRRVCWISITLYKPYAVPITPPAAHAALFGAFQAITRAHGGRPHWAKAHPLRREELRALYPRLDDFLRAVRAADPHGVFGSVFVERHVQPRAAGVREESAAEWAEELDVFRREVGYGEGDGVLRA